MDACPLRNWRFCSYLARSEIALFETERSREESCLDTTVPMSSFSRSSWDSLRVR